MKDLKEISEEMRKQDHRATQYPMFVIQDKVKIGHTEEGCLGEYSQRRDSDSGLDYDDLCESCSDLGELEMPDDCNECDDNAFFYYTEEWQFNLTPGVFFTAKACDEHIRLNHYHYTKHARSYGIGSWRNDEMVLVQQNILKLTGDIPSHYK